MSNKHLVSFTDALGMLGNYTWSRIWEQVKSVAFIIMYLVVFQTIILRVPLANALGTAGGIGLVVLGLAFFLEGLVLGLMPIGERVGVKLPARVGIGVICAFGVVLGFGATYAEPAISTLRAAGATITAWDSPLLYMMLNSYSGELVMSVGVGVGLAVALGMCRFYYNWSIKPLIYIIIPLVMLLTLYAANDDKLCKIIGLAWDCGAVTTGAVTVPLVLALGIGVSRTSSNGGGSNGGFGIIMLASAFPIVAVLALGSFFSLKTPSPVSENEFFAAENRTQSAVIFGGDTSQVIQHAFTHGSVEGRKAIFASEEAYTNAIKLLENSDEARTKYLGTMQVADWILKCATTEERDMLSNVKLSAASDEQESPFAAFAPTLHKELFGGLQAVLPITAFLLIVLIMLREKLRYKDEIALGIGITLFGMVLLTSGISLGLASLGGEVGAQLPRAFASEEKFIDRVVINNFDSTMLFKGITEEGEQKEFFNLCENGQIRAVEFNAAQLNTETKQYVQIITEKPMFKLSIIGLVLVLVFAFGLGFGATLAEPALNALGMTVEGLTVGAIKQRQLVLVVSVGVALGITLGLARILFDLPLYLMIEVSYGLLLVLTFFSDKEFSAIAWDSGGVTTGPVTVPLVLALGLSIGGVLHVSDGFGILAMASAWPIITVLLFGLIANRKQHKNLKNTKDDE
ncbi:MAG: DUF1538 domain-containing protein [Salinivirgaceae bacterium]|nr:DUF1538 domain-containing protein [Salinivirgaceae bacterium]